MNTRKYFIIYLHCGIFCLSYKIIVLNPCYDIFYSFIVYDDCYGGCDICICTFIAYFVRNDEIKMFNQSINQSYERPNAGESVMKNIPDSKVHGANMGPTWVLSAPDGPHVGPMNLAIRDVWRCYMHPQERMYKHNKIKHDRTMCIFYEPYCI